MNNNKPTVVILGAGPAGVGAAYQLSKLNKANVIVLEMKHRVGGNSGSFYEEGIYFDYGSHRLHPACHTDILNDIKVLIGVDLKTRPRHGRILLNNRWIHFPLKPAELFTQLSFKFSAGVFIDMLKNLLNVTRKHSSEHETFETALKRNLGKTICQEFYFPYAKKIWGISPDEISVVQAEKRVSANSFAKLLKKVFFKPKEGSEAGRPIFYYPQKGFGQITEAFKEEAEKSGTRFIFNARVKKINTDKNSDVSVIFEHDDTEKELEADFIWSTLPLTSMIRGVQPQPETNVIQAANDIKFRSMVLIYLFIEQNRFTEFDAHYFPEIDIPITRLSETKNYSDIDTPENLTGLCAELPCNFNDEHWNMSEHELGELVKNSLNKAGIPAPSDVKKVLVKRLKYAYPIYNTGFEANYEILDKYLQNIENLLMFGRQALFVHDNTHHALYMAYSAVNCLEDGGRFNKSKWEKYRKEFESHVVVD